MYYDVDDDDVDEILQVYNKPVTNLFICFRFPFQLCAYYSKISFELIWDMFHILLYSVCFSPNIITNPHPQFMHSLLYFLLIPHYSLPFSLSPLFIHLTTMYNPKKHSILFVTVMISIDELWIFVWRNGCTSIPPSYMRTYVTAVHTLL